MSVHWLKVMMIVSLATTTVFVTAKLIFYGVTYNDWQGIDVVRNAVFGAIISAIVTIVFKYIKYIPRYKHFRDVHNDKRVIDLKLTQRMIRLSIMMIILYSITVLVEINALHQANKTESYILMYGVIMALVTAPISIGITTAILVFALKTKKHYTHGTI